jgi:hypothetical protein
MCLMWRRVSEGTPFFSKLATERALLVVFELDVRAARAGTPVGLEPPAPKNDLADAIDTLPVEAHLLSSV